MTDNVKHWHFNAMPCHYMNTVIGTHWLLYIYIYVYISSIYHYNPSIVDYNSEFKTTVTWHDLWFALLILTYNSHFT
jgi:hypothetical protein